MRQLKLAIRQQWLGVCLALVAIALSTGGPAVAREAYLAAGRILTGNDVKDGSLTGKDVKDGSLTGKDVKDGSLAARDLSAFARNSLRGQVGATGPQGPPGPAGSPDEPSEVLAKLLGVDGAGSGLDADLLDGLTSSAFVADADSASGDVTGPFSDLQLATGSVGTNQLAQGAVTISRMKSGQPTDVFVGTTFNPPSIPAQGCHYRFVVWDEADQGELVIAAESPGTMAAGLMLLPTMARDGGVPIALCNFNTSNAVDDSSVTVSLTLVGS